MILGLAGWFVRLPARGESGDLQETKERPRGPFDLSYCCELGFLPRRYFLNVGRTQVGSRVTVPLRNRRESASCLVQTLRRSLMGRDRDLLVTTRARHSQSCPRFVHGDVLCTFPTTESDVHILEVVGCGASHNLVQASQSQSLAISINKYAAPGGSPRNQRT